MNATPSKRSPKNALANPKALPHAVEAGPCGPSLSEFIRQGWHVLEPGNSLDWNWHIDAIADHVQATLEDWQRKQVDPTYVQRIQNLLINVPPGTAKSRIVSVYTPAWMWARCPTWRAIFLSANPRVALRDSLYCRDVIESEWYRERFRHDWELTRTQNAKSLFRNTMGGFRQAMGFNSRITGDRADALFVDDPHDAEQVNSAVQREAVTERWKTAIGNRVNDLRQSVRIGIMQRLHSLDWSGCVLESGEWEHVCIAQEYEPSRARVTAIGWTDPRTVEGELLFPLRFPPKTLKAERDRLGPDGYAGQHQQRPVPAEGGCFKKSWFRYYKADPAGEFYQLEDDPPRNLVARVVRAKDCRTFGIVDLAFSTRKSADYTVITAWAVTPQGDLLLLDMIRERMEGPDIVPRIRGMSRKHNLPYVGIESVGAQLTVIQEARRSGLTVRGLDADLDKVSRSLPAQIRMCAGQILFPRGPDWVGLVEDELLAFDKGPHDDIVDNVSYAGREVQKFGPAPEPEELREAREQAEREAISRALENPLHPDYWPDDNDDE